ncbi:hypothetical protein NC651_014648 [Populus alba x Populus x berolinensis]|nr:hypothetical protein NC651_014648 [Populus alba x Populus x berolinensis]
MTSHASKLFKISRENVSSFATNLVENSTRNSYMKHFHRKRIRTISYMIILMLKHVSDHLSKLVENTWSDLGAGGDGGCNLQGGDQGSNQDKEAKHSYNYYKAYNYLRERREK